MTFPNFESFIERHEAATIAEFDAEAQRIEDFNNERWKFKAAVLTAPSETQPYQSHVLRVDLSQIGIRVFEKGELRFVDGNRTSGWCSFRRGEDVIPLDNSWNKCTELLVYVPPADAARFRDTLRPLLRDNTIKADQLRNDGRIKWVEVQLQLQASEVTVNTERRALRWLVNGIAGEAGSSVFSYLMEFKNPKRHVNFCDLYPQVANLDLIPDSNVRLKMQDTIDRFDEDQRKAYHSLDRLPEGVAFIPGGPGAGKTRWALTVALLAQAGVNPCKVLYLVDINSAVDDSADRMQAIYENVGIKKTVMRLPSWGGVDKEFLEDGGSGGGIPRGLMNADFTEGFLHAESSGRDEGKAPTLHRRAWELYQSQEYVSSQGAQYNNIQGALWKIQAKGGHQKNYQVDVEVLRKTLIPLYFTAIRDTDFIATTPIAARLITKIFRPDIVIFDECGHARELTTVTSLAFFRPKAFFFVGDHRQTEPYTEETGHRYEAQLKISTMERADANGAAPNQLLVNHRAHGGLERLASGLFYKGRMRSDKVGRNDLLFPRSVVYLQKWLQSIPDTVIDQKTSVSGKLEPGGVPRLIIDHWGNSYRQARDGTSSWSETHLEFVMEKVMALLQDQNFKQLDGNKPGTIMIISPYKAAMTKYLQAIQSRGLKKRRKDRVMVRTVDTAQGQEADVVFLDLVKDHGTVHTDNAKRLCVSLTRARQAEIIMMCSDMVSTQRGGVNFNTGRIWRLCQTGEAGAILHIRPRQANYTTAN
ncbi:P-loop containing nucleoside triphosphate hydrolase protein [Cladorrhinum sp. PSN259]|nr:P-loop containing nucleoside triphosphate hydrolase protein [Cladorrhinum sp. PSN259]